MLINPYEPPRESSRPANEIVEIDAHGDNSEVPFGLLSLLAGVLISLMMIAFLGAMIAVIAFLAVS